VTYWSRYTEPLPIGDVELYAKLISKCRDGQRFIHTAEGLKELSEEEFAKALIDEWKDSPRETVFNMIDHMLKL